MAKGNKGKPAWKNEPEAKKSVKIQASPESTDKLTPAWQFHRRDRDHAEWGWGKLTADQFCSLLHDQLGHFETMTWAEILRAVGDKKSGNQHHNIAITKCCKAAQERLAELMADDVDEVFSLRLTNKLRLFGIKDGRVLRFLWHDPEHSVYPLKG